jgi:type IV secretion system protein VirB10
MNEREPFDVYSWVKAGGGRNAFFGFATIIILVVMAYVSFGIMRDTSEKEKDLSKVVKSTLPVFDKERFARAMTPKAPPMPLEEAAPKTDRMVRKVSSDQDPPGWLLRKRAGGMIVQTNYSGSEIPLQGNEAGVIPPQESPSEGSLTANIAIEKRKGVSASRLANRNFLIAQGAAIDCVLETALDSSLPGMATCRVTRDVYSDNGKVVLLDRGSQLIGEYTNSVKQGQSRIFVVWTRAKTPDGVIINLDSPGADALGMAGLDGWVDHHFMERFGAAILMSFVQDAAMVLTSAESSRGAGSTTVFSGYGNMGTGGSNVASNILNYTANVSPNVIKNQGDSIRVMVARDLDFSPVYSLQKVDDVDG